jgi:hypothetical protein
MDTCKTVRVVHVALGMGYTPGEGNRRASLHMSDLPPETPLLFDSSL